MNKISQHFTIEEFECHCGCDQLIVKRQLVEMAEEFRAYLCEKYKQEVAINVHCVNRCKEHNDSLPNSVPTSTHITGRAMDLHAPALPMAELHKSAEECFDEEGILWGGLGYYNWGIHIDVSRFRTWGKKV